MGQDGLNTFTFTGGSQIAVLPIGLGAGAAEFIHASPQTN